MRNKKRHSRRHCAFQCAQTRRYVIVRINCLSDIVQQSRENEFLIPRTMVARQFEYLQAVIEGVAFGMPRRVLLHIRKGLKKDAIELERINMVFKPFDLGFERQFGVFLPENFSNSGAVARSMALPGDRAFENVMCLVFGIKCQLNVVAVFNVNMREKSLCVVLMMRFSSQPYNDSSVRPGSR